MGGNTKYDKTTSHVYSMNGKLWFSSLGAQEQNG